MPVTGPVALDVPSGKPPAACKELLARLPVAVADQGRRDVTPADAPGAAWGDPPITLVCGVGVPEGFDNVASCLTVSGVDWYIPTEQLEARGDLTMTTVKRAVNVEVHLPAAYFPPATTLADLAAPIRKSLPRTGHCF
jgi:Protein of unknown function (DUF3515)